MALRDQIVSIVREVFAAEIEKWREELSIAAEITTGPDGSKKGYHNQQVWLKEVAASSTDETGPLWLADNFDGSNQVGKRVRYGTNIYTGKKEILGMDYSDLGFLTNGDTFSDVSEHANIHEASTNFNQPFQTHGRDVVSLGVPNFKPLRTRPSAAGGVAVDVESYEYVYDSTSVVFGGVTNLSLSSAIPGASLQRFVAVYLDKATNTIKTANGSTIAINAGRPPDPTISDTNIIISAYVRIYNGQTAIDAINDISDQRDLIGGAVKISNVPYSNAGTGTQLTTDDDVAVTDDVQFRGAMLLAPDAGDALSTTTRLLVQQATGTTNIHIRLRDDDDTRYRSDLLLADAGGGLAINSYDDTGAVYLPIKIQANDLCINDVSGGSVAINTTDTPARLTIDDPGGGGESNVRIRDGDATRYRSDWGLQASGAGVTFNAYDDTGADYIPLKIDGKNLLLNSASGDNVSINTTAAPARLTVDDPGGGAQSHIRIRDSDATRYRCDWAVLASGTGALINSYDDTGAVYLPFRIDANDLVLNLAATAGNVGIKTASPGAPLHVEQTGASTTEAVIKLVQANDDEDIFEIVGSATVSDITKTLVDEGDQAGQTREGWIKIVIQDDGNQITDGIYFIPFYSLT